MVETPAVAEAAHDGAAVPGTNSSLDWRENLQETMVFPWVFPMKYRGFMEILRYKSTLSRRHFPACGVAPKLPSFCSTTTFGGTMRCTPPRVGSSLW